METMNVETSCHKMGGNIKREQKGYIGLPNGMNTASMHLRLFIVRVVHFRLWRWLIGKTAIIATMQRGLGCSGCGATGS